MGILDKPLQLKNTKNFYFGAPEAEGENIVGYKLIDYFEDYLDILNNLEKGKFIFTGRKGVGKSAIAKFIKDKSDLSNNSFATILRISDFNIQKNIHLSGEQNQVEVLLFEWLILVNIVKLIVNNDCGSYTQEYSKLKKFLDNNTGFVDIDKFQIDEGFNKTGGEISFGVLTHAFGGIFKKYFDVKVSRAPFYKLIQPLKEILKIILDYPINKELEFWLLFDDLDINYDLKSPKDNQKIIELLRLAKHYNNEVFNNNKAKILVFIRDDIRNNLVTKYPDSAKIFASYEIFINWYNHFSSSIDENNNPLKRLANKRIEINFKNHNIQVNSDAWSALINNEAHDYKTSFKYVLDYTFYRPRDIITFLSVISKENYTFPITSNNLKKIIDQYIKLNVTEIKSELSLYFNEDEKDLIFKDVFPYIINYQGVMRQKLIDKIISLDFGIHADKVIDVLLDYSLLIYQYGNGDLLFNYRENNELDRVDIDQLKITLPKCIYHYYRKIS